ncbi:LamG-like jellyroll fold domain-containing protein [Vibrio nomapromontoriensis]|uniref:LamG-like jellyroll fold domain-containing protein n=1 Tax=Vibrio nomapromontoriensis TaxID=2910246 RepID=UPI003D10961F
MKYWYKKRGRVLLWLFFPLYAGAASVSNTTIAHWEMELPHDSIVKDTISTFYRAENLTASFLTYGSPPIWSEDVPENLSGYSLEFNGLSAGLTIPANKKMGTADFSVVSWVRPMSVSAGYQAVYSSRGAAQGSVIYISPQGHWEFWLQSPEGWSKVVGPKVVLGEWAHITTTFLSESEGDNNVQTGIASLYLNGVEVAENPSANYQPDTLAKIGVGYRGSSNQYFYHGNIAQVEVYKTALYASEVEAHFNSNTRPDSLLAMWQMNEGTGTKVTEPLSQDPNPEDVLQFNHPGLRIGAPHWSEDTATGSGYALAFDGLNDGVMIEQNPELNLQHFSLSLWVKPEGSSTVYQTPFASRGESGGYQIYLTPDKMWQFWLNSGGSWSRVGSAKATLGQWQHLVATFEADDEISRSENEQSAIVRGTAALYLDGKLLERLNDVDYQQNLDAKMGIGYRGSDNQYFFEGKIDDVEVISGALSEAEVRAKAMMPIAKWHFSERVGEWVYDAEHNHNGQLRNDPKRVTVRRSDVKSLGIKFKGSEGIDIPISPAFSAPHFTISSWVKVKKLNGNRQVVWSSTDDKRTHELSIDEQGKWHFLIGDGQVLSTLDGPEVTPNTWTFVTLTFRGELDDVDSEVLVGEAKLYLDGQLQATTNNMRYRPNQSRDLSIGFKRDNTQHFRGVIDEVSFYGQSLNDEQISSLFRGTDDILDQSSWDKGQAEWDSERWPGAIRPESQPLIYPALYQRERELFGYDPRYYPNIVTFDGRGRQVIVAGAYEKKDDNSTIYPSYGFPSEQFIQLKSAKGWKSYSVNDALRSAFNKPSWDGSVWSGAKLIHERVEFDNDGDAYLLACVNEPINDQNHWVLLYSKSGEAQFKQWQGYTLPSRAKTCSYQNGHYNFQAVTPNTNRDVPPVLIYDQANIVPIEKTGDGLLIDTPVSLILESSGITEFIAGYSHSGGMNSSATIGDYTHFVFARLDSNLGNNITDTDIYYASYNHISGEVTLPQYLTSTGSCCLSPDNHNIPFILVDSGGALHVMAGSHQAPFVYLSAQTGSSGELAGKWSHPVEVVSKNALGQPFNTYPGLVIDSQDTIHMVFRKVDEHDRYSLHYMRKHKDGAWQDVGSIVVPALGRYSVFYHKLSVAPNDDLYLNYFFYHHFLSDDNAKEYRERWPLELIETGGTAEVNLYSGIKAHNGVILKSRNGGKSWKLFGSSEARQ